MPTKHSRKPREGSDRRLDLTLRPKLEEYIRELEAYADELDNLVELRAMTGQLALKREIRHVAKRQTK